MRSLREFSKMAGVSPATVSRVFSNSDTISAATAQRIRELAQSVGFRPNAVSRAAFGGATRSIGILLPDLSTSFFNDIAIGLQQRLLQDDYLPMVLQYAGVTGGESRAVRRLVDHRVDGLVLSLTNESLTPDDFATMLKAHLPMALVGGFQDSLSADTICNNGVQGSQLVAEHLIRLGHRSFGFCYYGDGHSTCDARLSGFREVLNNNGLLLRGQDISRLPPHVADPVEAHRTHLRAVLSRPDRPTAIFASTDHLATDVYAVAREMNLRIPEDLSVVGYANLNFSSLIYPPLTTVRECGREMGEQAAVVILERLQHPRSPRRAVTIPSELVLRASTAPPNSQ
ncbi:MAG: LacI family DNA-binding transcriptional regulator [Phycisphaerae bacterium]